tara:strand:+ start:805 stop:2580 length:1776 start_codon:yes stop_codon:yes gene_type:complete
MSELKRIFSLDLRSLALMRIGVGTVLIWDLIDRLLQFQFFYAVDGVIPYAASQEYYAGMPTWSLHLLIESDVYQYLLFSIHLLLAIALLLGWRARAVAFGCWLLFSSMIARAPVLLTGGDMLMASMLFWLMWIPSGRFFSIRKRDEPPIKLDFCSFATAGILLQFVVMYTLTGIYKWNPEWHDGTALFVIMDDEALTKPLGLWLTQFPGVLKALTYSTLALELAASVLLLSPLATDKFRIVGVISFIGLHAGIFLTMEVLGFSPISIAGLLAFIPALVWQCKPLSRLSNTTGDQSDTESLADHSQPLTTIRKLEECGAGIGLSFMMFFAIWQMLLHVGIATANYNVNWVIHQLRMDQTWTMFHVPSNLCYRYLLEGRTAEGKFIDLLRGNKTRETVDDIPEIPNDPIRFESSRWLLLYRQMGTTQYGNQQLHTIRHLQKHNPAANDLPTASELEIKEIVFQGAAGIREFRNQGRLSLLSHVDFRALGDYLSGQPHGMWEHYRDNGALDSKGSYQQGLRHGNWEFYHPNGQLASEGNFDLGHEHGLWTMYDIDGNRTAHGEFIDGQKEGTWTFWYDNGGMSTGDFKDDELVQ